MVAPLQVVGFKKSGKTTTIQSFLAVLKQYDQSVIVLKHDAHNASMDQPQTDTAKFSQAGAATTILATAQGIMLHQKITEQPKAADLVAQYRQADQFCLLEGFKEANYPKLVLVRPGEKARDFTQLSHVLAFASLTQPEFSDCIDFSTTTKREAWFNHFLQGGQTWPN
ncbi:molybdopterin-guanine dinucleotide biosynthesis protein B [Loigolactobacillus backii]|uniref:molybdopterin-guanine dinucleotide biosynthesis protein B n=1 Tax=Loigolactobacillus backii TaxID=375175 RepID=UPI0022FD7BE0|nr:molybdopterin-guanine dinucleotide biosynthesis protein B [Loigolactobacillus backii]MDA5386727.1 molybdopterin-guanine dinucleotide biosynthesis protein B [Loigolactobacillus backii]MDA5389252.1 molybdopterin-guanine dinucleotide biosynthesis protein B [Loigolactobacillus backii]